MAKEKVKGINDWPEAETVLGEIQELNRQMKAEGTKADAKIATIRKDTKVVCDSLKKDITRREAALEDFVVSHKKDMEPLKSKRLAFGKVGVRDEPKFKWPKKNETLITRLKEKGLKKYIKYEPVPDKEGIMAHWKELPLKALGVTRRKLKDVFYLKLNNEE